MKVKIDRFVLDAGCGKNTMKTVVKRYLPSPAAPTTRVSRGGSNRKDGSGNSKDADAFILLLAHGIGFHKEQWEPVIEQIFEHCATDNYTSLPSKSSSQSTAPTKILEAWTIDRQDHGEAALLNAEYFRTNPLPNVFNYADAIVSLYQSGLLNQSSHGAAPGHCVPKVILAGHSAGAIAVIFATHRLLPQYPNQPFPAPSLQVGMSILADPPWFDSSSDGGVTRMFKYVGRTTKDKRSHWPSRAAAYEWMSTRAPWNTWDPRVLRIYTEHGLHTVSLGSSDAEQDREVVLACGPAHEVAAFSTTPERLEVTEHLNHLCQLIPFHLVFGERSDMFSRRIQDTIPDPSSGRVIASITRVKGAGHLVLQEQPDRLADTLYAIIKAGHGVPGFNLKETAEAKL